MQNNRYQIPPPVVLQASHLALYRGPSLEFPARPHLSPDGHTASLLRATVASPLKLGHWLRPGLSPLAPRRSRRATRGPADAMHHHQPPWYSEICQAPSPSARFETPGSDALSTFPPGCRLSWRRTRSGVGEASTLRCSPSFDGITVRTSTLRQRRRRYSHPRIFQTRRR